MTIAAKVSPSELTAQVTNRFANKYLEARLVNAPGTTYLPGVTNDVDFLSFEVVDGTGGYTRQVIGYSLSDVLAYSDDGVPLNRKATIFAHDGSGTALEFTHVALCWSTGNILTIGSATTAPDAGVNGTYTNIPTSTNGSGTGLTIDLTITNNGALDSDYSMTVNSPGSGYDALDVITIPEGTLAGLGAVSAGDGGLGFVVATVNSDASGGTLISVAETASNVILTGGNEAVFYWDLKQFGFYSA